MFNELTDHSHRITVNVVISNATRVPGRNFALFNCRRQPTTYRGPFVALTITENQKGKSNSED